jgi:8-oxo-dGTP pyrophosphatase MutT (NUDIX family)
MQPKICYTAAGILIHERKVLLVKHKKLGIWLNPGGHIEGAELPHQAAEREFFEETGVKVVAYDPRGLLTDTDSTYLPSPILSNVHWVCPENFAAREKNPDNYELHPKWQRGCEQHLGFLYLVKPVAGVDFVEDTVETDGIQWFGEDAIAGIETRENIRKEIGYAFQLL